MSYAVSAEAAAPTRFERTTNEGKALWRTLYFGPPPSPASSDSVRPDAPLTVDYADPAPDEVRPPQAFLVEQAPGAITHPHFHYVDQFQVVVAGGGSIGRNAVEPVVAQFAAASTGYGPITPDDRGIAYFTFRASADETGAQFLPNARERMRPGARRNVFFDAVKPSASDALAARKAFALDVLRDDADGLGGFVLRIPPHMPVNAPTLAASAGASMVVLAGALDRSGMRLGRWSCLFYGPDEGLPLLQAASDGAEVLVLRYPRSIAAV